MNRPLTLFALASVALITYACGESHHHPHTHGSTSAHNRYKPGDGGIDLRNDEVVIRAGGTSEDAHVAVDGSLSIGGKAVDISPEGRAALKAYNAEAIAIEQHGVALGVAGAKFGWKTVGEVIGGLFDGTADKAGERAKEGADQLVESARELCTRLGTMYEAQEAGAAAIAEFKPYAVIAQHQVHDCFDDDGDSKNKNNGKSDDGKDADDDDDEDSDAAKHSKDDHHHHRVHLDPFFKPV